jgi:uncharacterized cupin superfamily protein
VKSYGVHHTDLHMSEPTIHTASPESMPGVVRIDPHSVEVPVVPLGQDASSPSAGFTQVASIDDMAVGIWDHTAGTSTHTEEDEVFIILSGSVIVTEDGADPIEFGAGDIGILRSGARTTWSVTQPLRKIWVAREPSDG